MIEQIRTNNLNTAIPKTPQKKPQFKGLGLVDGVIKGIEVCEKYPMANVTLLDVVTAIGPRTAIESKTNFFAGFEAFRRESSGLLVNCLIPGFVVLGLSKLLQRPFMGKNSHMGSSWANEDTIRTISKYWEKADGTGKDKIKDTIVKIVNDASGKDGEATVLFKDKESAFTSSLDNFADIISDPNKKIAKKDLEEVVESIVKHTNVAEHITTGQGDYVYKGKLSSLLRDTPQILREFVKNNIHDADAINKFITKSTRLVTAKSILGLGVIIPLAISMQTINRWITAKTSGKKGAPIYKDFKESTNRELSPEEKKGLAKQKLISVGSMVGVALLSILMEKPDIKTLKKITQFNGLFPTMDQARLISTATFASRMMAAEDKNELREATVRDIATFSAFYFLGDYVAKGMASLIQAVSKKKGGEIKLINRLDDWKESSNVLGKFWNWAKNTSLKTSEELINNGVAKKMRSICQLSNIGFSLVALGVLIPLITRNKTDKEREAELKKMGADKNFIEKYYPHFMMNHPKSASKGNVYQAFFTSK